MSWVHPNPIRGERHHKAKLTEADVRNILELYPEVSTRRLAEKFEVSQSAIARIVSCRNWRHI